MIDLVPAKHHIPVKPIETSRQVKRLLDQGMRIQELSAKIGKSRRWIWERMRLLNLCPEARNLVDDHLIGIKNGVLLSALALTEQERHILAAKGMKVKAFTEYIRSCKTQGN